MDQKQMTAAVKEAMRQDDRRRSQNALVQLGIVAAIVFGIVVMVWFFTP